MLMFNVNESWMIVSIYDNDNWMGFLRSFWMTLQYLNGSPVYPEKQVQDGKWLTTWQTAFWPQVPGQGSWHLFEMQARFDGQSELRTHSGLHPS